MNKTLQSLIGKEIQDVQITADKQHLKFITNSGEFVIFAFGDCCSQSWFEAFENLDNLLGEILLEIIEKEENKPDLDIYHSDDRKYGPDEVIRFYGFTFKTKKGFADLEMRNSSNGYYGGSITDRDDKWDWVEPIEPFKSYKDL